MLVEAKLGVAVYSVVWLIRWISLGVAVTDVFTVISIDNRERHRIMLKLILLDDLLVRETR